MVQSPLNAIVISHFTSLFISLHFEVLLDAQVIFCFLKYTSPLWLIQQKVLLFNLAVVPVHLNPIVLVNNELAEESTPLSSHSATIFIVEIRNFRWCIYSRFTHFCFPSTHYLINIITANMHCRWGHTLPFRWRPWAASRFTWRRKGCHRRRGRPRDAPQGNPCFPPPCLGDNIALWIPQHYPKGKTEMLIIGPLPLIL